MANVITSLVGRSPFVVLSSTARTASPDTQEFEAYGVNYRALHLIVDVTAVGVTPSVTVKIQGVDRVSGKTYDILTSAALTATGTTVLKVGPALTAAANTVANDFVPPIFRVTATHGNAVTITYSIAGMLCP